MKKIFIGIILGAGILFLVLFSFGFLEKDEEENDLEYYSGAENHIWWFIEIDGYPELIYRKPDLVAALTKPEQVRVYRVKNDGELKVGNYHLSSETKLSEDYSKMLSKIVCSPTSMRGASACSFSPGFAVRFDHDNKSIYAFVCYSCRDIMFLNEAGEELSGWGMSNDAETILLHIFYDLFPNDQEVQNLKL